MGQTSSDDDRGAAISEVASMILDRAESGEKKPDLDAEFRGRAQRRNKTYDRRQMLEERKNRPPVGEREQQILNKAIEEHAPGASVSERKRAVAMGLRDMSQSGSGRSGSLEKEKQEIAANPAASREIINSKQTKFEREKSLGAMISLLLPVIAGAAISGNKGAARGFIGGAEEQMKDLETAEKREYEEKIYNERRGDKVEDAIKIAAARNPQKSDEEKLEYRKKEKKVDAEIKRESEIIKEIDKGGLIVNRAKNALEQFTSVASKKGVLSYQMSKLFSGTDTAKAAAQIRGIIFDIVKEKQGSRPSDYDVQALMSIAMGNWTASGQDAADLFKQVIDGYERDLEYKRKLINGDVSEEEKAEYESGRIDPIMNDIRAAIDAGKSPEVIAQYLDRKAEDLGLGDKLETYKYYATVYGGKKE